MDSLFHFILAIMAAMIVGLHRKHGLRVVFLIALAAVFIDLDHWFIPSIVMKPLHNIFFIVLFPLALFLIFYKYEKKRSIKWQTYALILLVVLVSHLVADFFYGPSNGVPLLYPFSTAIYLFPQYTLGIPMPAGDTGYIITPTAIAFLTGFIIFMLAHFIEDFVYYFRKKHMSFKKACKRVFSQI